MNEMKIDSPSGGGDAAELQRQTPPGVEVRPRRQSGFIRAFGWIARGTPTIVVLALLGALAWYGRQHGWQLPKFSAWMKDPADNTNPWCDEHGVAEADCIACNAELLPKGELFGWCREHGVHECLWEHPQLAQLDSPPEISAADLERAKLALSIRPRTANNPSCKMHLRRIQFPSIEAADRAGIDIALVDRGPIVETISVNGVLNYDPTRVAHVSARAAGTLTQVLVNVGDRVSAGQILAVVDAAEVGKAKSDLLDKLVALDLARKANNRLRQLGGDAIPARDLERAEAAVAAAEVAVTNAAQQLSNLGLPIHSIDYYGQSVEEVNQRLQYLGLPVEIQPNANHSSNLLPIVAPREGVVVMREVVAGELVAAGFTLFTIVDPSQIWLMLNVPLEESERIRAGQSIVFRPDGSPTETRGQVAWISTDVDPQTRTVQVRGELDNRDGRLRHETFGRGEIILREESDAIVVPSEAIHWEGCCHVAFVRTKNYFREGAYKVIHARSVRLGVERNGMTEVIAGLLPGEVVITQGSGMLRAELLKGNLGAG